MLLPSTNDTILAVASAWSPSPIGILRLSGPAAFALVRALLVDQTDFPESLSPAANPTGPPMPTATSIATANRHRMLLETQIRIDENSTLPATLLCFRAPHSYTGQDLIEIHTIGCLPLLREICAILIDRGARRALPGEFTARAFLAGKLDAGQVNAVLALIRSDSDSSARSAARAVRNSYQRQIADLTARLTDLLAMVEAGIDFVDEEDISFVSPQVVRETAGNLLETLQSWRGQSEIQSNAARPHVALAGLPNAGKSTLFNTLIGFQRAIVSPVVGTTRDVISADIRIAGVDLVLQDSAGLGITTGELESAAHLAAESAAQQADLVLWLHDRARPWEQLETDVLAAIASDRRLLVMTKFDAPVPVAQALPGRDDGVAAVSTAGSPLPPLEFIARANISCATGVGIDDLKSILGNALGQCGSNDSGSISSRRLEDARDALTRVLALAHVESAHLPAPELVALEIRLTLEALDPTASGPTPDAVLGRIFAQFCVGK